MELKEGDVVLDKYRIEEPLGSGGMGLVVAARHLVLDERVAIKVLRRELTDNEETVARFVREAKAAVRIRSEHVVRVSDVGRLTTGEPFIVMELLDGRDLAQVLYDEGPLPVAQAVDFLLQAGEALAAAHAMGIIHRDLKPANMFLTTGVDGMPLLKVLDFGISKFLDGGSTTALARTQGVVGSPLYMSPEQISSSLDVDTRADVWSLGVVFFELLTGAMPFVGGDMAQLVFQVLSSPPRRVSTLKPELPSDLDRILERCLAKNPADRYQDVAALARDLAPHGTSAARQSCERIMGIVRVVPSSSTREVASRTLTPINATASTRVSIAGLAASTSGIVDRFGPTHVSARTTPRPAHEPLAGSLVPSVQPPTPSPSRPLRSRRGAVTFAVVALALIGGVVLGMRSVRERRPFELVRTQSEAASAVPTRTVGAAATSVPDVNSEEASSTATVPLLGTLATKPSTSATVPLVPPGSAGDALAFPKVPSKLTIAPRRSPPVRPPSASTSSSATATPSLDIMRER